MQQIYGIGVGATLVKTPKREFDITADLHYEGQQFNATADVYELNLQLIGSSLTEAYSRKWGKISFEKKIAADIAWNNASAFSASANGSVRTPIYKKLGFSVSAIDYFLNNPQLDTRRIRFSFQRASLSVCTDAQTLLAQWTLVLNETQHENVNQEHAKSLIAITVPITVPSGSQKMMRLVMTPSQPGGAHAGVFSDYKYVYLWLNSSSRRPQPRWPRHDHSFNKREETQLMPF